MEINDEHRATATAASSSTTSAVLAAAFSSLASSTLVATTTNNNNNNNGEGFHHQQHQYQTVIRTTPSYGALVRGITTTTTTTTTTIIMVGTCRNIRARSDKILPPSLFNISTESSIINLWKLANEHIAIDNESDLAFGQHVQQQQQQQQHHHHQYANNFLTNNTSLIGGVNGIGTTSLINVNNNLMTSTAASAFDNNTFEVQDAVSLWDVWLGKPFPSGYTQLAIVLLAFFLACIMILVVVGNMLVCIAIATEKSLKPVQNWFIASLAVSDFFIGLIIMPFSLARELMGYWMFGQVWCDIHAALDILLCTASINSLFLISLDRYWSITQAVKYLKKRTPSRAAFMIAFVWIFSALVSLPPLVGWKKLEQSSEYPQCNLSEDIGYVLYSSIGSFYFPALMMVFVYIRIFIAARSRARRHIEKKRLKMPQQQQQQHQLQQQMTTTTNESGKEKSQTTTATMFTSLNNPSPPDIKESSNIESIPIVQVNVVSNSSMDCVYEPKCPIECVNDETSSNLPLTNKSPPPPQIIIEATPESRRQSWNIISTSELISSMNIDGDCQLLPITTNTNTTINTAIDTSTITNINPLNSSSPMNKVEESVEPITIQQDNGTFSTENSESESPPPPTPPPVTNETTTSNGNTERKSSKIHFPKFKTVSNATKAFRFRRPRLSVTSSKENNGNNHSKSVTVDDDSDTADSPTSKDIPNYESKAFLSAPKLLRSKFGSTMSIADYDNSDLMEDSDTSNKRGSRGKGRVQYHEQPVVGPSDAERHKRKIAKARERRATLIVGLIMAAFITAWLPFFVLYVLAALCTPCKETIPEGVFAVAFWLGYCNSASSDAKMCTKWENNYRVTAKKKFPFRT
ncbi:hypothetical protein RDWZM_000858 [Blomia tropicalis]|uniref:G-protein coupled receptors family 1 profile domain-containing protein n=1 Tax=Blomia tropicalis TaxID=40697 RepID=A0A9Q0MBQ9_BLOTA|nr:hypothetical protein RDWZM_000858 [Blomia tropicalis]